MVLQWTIQLRNGLSDEEVEAFEDWEITLLQEASFYDGDINLSRPERKLRIFKDRIEEWKQNAIDGTGTGPCLSLSEAKKNTSRFRLQEKYKGMHFVDKDPEGDNQYYVGKGTPLPPAEWEHRKILGLAWQKQKGWRLVTKLYNDPTGVSTNYVINAHMIRMIKESTRNRLVRLKVRPNNIFRIP